MAQKEKYRILVVDDNHLVRKLLGEIIESAGYEIFEAENGKLALKVFRENPFDLVITDIFMPEVDGLEIIKALHGDYPDVKIIAISGDSALAPDNYLRLAEDCGAFRIFSKPIKVDDLLNAIEEAITT
ncbi:response regulator [Thermodesulfobacteriota bacterium]